uniref:TNF receptor-associated factor 3-like n=1 Tax=Ciona intestinalis TaxID=7719 RepID=F7BIZ0_CIOIN|nr:TNF receptor-associated factor 3-like [Ciona intestinalis]|eukprot:XP_002130602.1 TNF receptor-associated factor 3-like [Ciona intestinalis]
MLDGIKKQLEKVKTTNNVKTVTLAVAKLEQKMVGMQRTVAQQIDNSLAIKNEIKNADISNKRMIPELNQKLKEMIEEMTRIRQKQNELERKLSTRNQENEQNFLAQINGFEQQIGLYDVRIADMDQRFQVLETTSYSGVALWKINNFQRRKREAESGRALSIYSQPFYTSRYGYKMCARVYLNGDGMGKGTHVSLFFVLMKGEYDNLLPWPFRQKVTLMLLDQGLERRHLSDMFRPDPTSSSFTKPTSDMNIASGCPLFVAHNLIEGSSYVKDDVIFIRIHVDTTDLETF